MNWILRALLLFFIVSSGLFGADIAPITFEKQLRDSDGIIHAKFLGSKYKLASAGQVMTEASFIIMKLAGINNNEIINVNNFQVTYPGGKWLGVDYQDLSSPTFIKGEEVILLLKKNVLGHGINNLKLGKYKIFKEEGKKYISSSAFPNHKDLGKIPWTKFEKMVTKAYGNVPIRPRKDKSVYTRSKKMVLSPNRMPASLEKVPLGASEDNRVNILWVAIIFAAVVLFFFWFTRASK